MPLAEVKTLYSHNATEIVKMLRMLADNIEKGQLPNIVHAVCSVRDVNSRSQHYAWGEQTGHEALSLHQCAVRVLCDAIDNGPIREDKRTITP